MHGSEAFLLGTHSLGAADSADGAQSAGRVEPAGGEAHAMAVIQASGDMVLLGNDLGDGFGSWEGGLSAADLIANWFTGHDR